MSLRKTRENDPIRLRHMLDWARNVESIATGETRRTFDDNRILQLAVARSLQNVGEAANNITAETRRSHAAIPWVDIIGMRHRLVHVYYKVDMDVIWRTVFIYVPQLIVDLEKLMREEYG